MRIKTSRSVLISGLGLCLTVLFISAVSGCRSASREGAGEPDDVVEQLVVLSPEGEGYPDPEILQEESLMTFQAGNGNIWLAHLDHEDGTFLSHDGKDVLLDTGGAPLRITYNGPEFGINASGWAVYYAKGNAVTSQVWQAVLSGNEVLISQLTDGLVHNNQLATKNTLSGDPIKVMCVRHDPPDEDIVYFSVDNPSLERYVTAHDQQNIPVRWFEGGRFICVRENNGQLFLLDTADAARYPVSNDAGDKTDPNGWFAPDYGGDMLIAAVLDDRAVAVYRNTAGTFWERVATLDIPESSSLNTVGSPEPFVFRRKSYLSLTIKDSLDGKAEVWIMSVDGAYEENCGDGSPVRRADPEVFIGSSHVFVYYYLIPSLELRRWRSGLSVYGKKNE